MARQGNGFWRTAASFHYFMETFFHENMHANRRGATSRAQGDTLERGKSFRSVLK
jgi:hypothetical protein